MEKDRINLKSKLLNKNKLAKRFSLTYIVIGVIGAVSFHKLLKIYTEENNLTSNDTFTFNIIFVLFTFIIFVLMINHMQKVIKNIDTANKELLFKDKQRLIPYEFALNNSVDAIYWFTLDAKFVYVNDAACNMLGYERDELLGKNLEMMDPNFDRQGAIGIMHKIFITKNWSLETTQRKKMELF